MKALALVGVTVVLAHLPSVAAAQSPRQNSPGWEVDVMGGVSRTSAETMTSSGNVVADGPIFTAPGIIVQGVRSVSTWFLSSSSAFVIPGIQPLTDITHQPGISGHSLGTIAGHITDWRTPRFGIEVTLSYGARAPTSFADSTLSSIGQSGTSFQNAFGAIFAASPALYGNAAVTAVTSDTNHAGGQLIATGGAVWAAKPGKTVPYVTAGVGIRARVGDDPTVTLTGNYAFTAPGGVPIAETDKVSLRYHTSNSALFAFGAGLRHWVTSSGGIRLDFRATLGSETTSVHVDATPSSTTGTPGGFVVQQPANGNATIVFSNTPSQRTSLSGPAVVDLATAAASGFRFQWALTAGWFWRF
jgi:hypothetical protein